ncbi:diacylglycerol kinase family protein [Nocardioides sp. AE5]|uniref:diacylglycerol kinase family protein n=1 Tax=Nocardioides sp. AE5 TaxID=2962573 RepID=UPI0028821549|nr:diacylglycerol kinase family protein [Nocardioides sp. AE5]MDT0202498.1 diacylglycerol kinase family protein [Nocardioides sp. AE5]
MTDRSATTIRLVWATVLLGAFAVLTLLVATSWSPLVDLDHSVVAETRTWPADGSWLEDFLRWLEHVTGTIAGTVYLVALVAALALNAHRRAAAYVAIVIVTTFATTHLFKMLLGRDRPEIQAAFDELSNGSYPSGHASNIAALAGVLIVVTHMLARRAGVRRLLDVLLLALVVAVCMDRLLLARHYPSDVIGGLLLGSGLVLLVLALFSPQPRSTALTAAPLVTSVPATTRDLHVVLNPIKVEDVGQFKATVAELAAESGWNEPVWHLTSVEDPGTGMAASASVAGADLVIVCGGDGTVREVCAELAGTGIPVGIIPAGTGNLLARNLDIPLYLRSAIDVALNGQDRAIDMVRVSGDGGVADTHFMVMAGMGFDAAIMEGVNEDIKKRVGWLAYVWSALKSLMFPAVKVEITVDDEPPTTHRARTIVVGNVGYLQAGMPLLPDAAIDDGVLDVVLLHPKRFLSWFPLAFRVLTKASKTDETIERFTGRKVVIRAASDTPRQLDGDAIGPGKELVMECIHGRLLVRAPR